MQLNRRPIAFVDESGYVVPNPTFSSESIKHLKGRFIYDAEEFDNAVDEMNRKQEERRRLADKYYGAEAVRVPAAYEDVNNVITEMDGTRETVPSFTAAPNRTKKTTGKSHRVVAPNEAPLPESLHEQPRGMNLTEEELQDNKGIDVDGALTAMFGNKK